jgi:hypothetical protein
MLGALQLNIDKEILHSEEMNDKRFNIDIDIDVNMNMQDIARNIIEPISFLLFHGHRNSVISD